LAEIGVFWADAGRNDDDDGDLGNVCCGFEETEEDEDEESTLLAVDFALGIDDKGLGPLLIGRFPDLSNVIFSSASHCSNKSRISSSLRELNG